ncbi:hypothetical protein FRC01_000231, partial [Tulasnella sp. 417]
DAEECEEFISAVTKHAHDQGKLRDDEWIADFVATCVTHDALRWWSGLDKATRGDWDALRQAMFSRYQPKFYGKSGEEAEEFVHTVRQRARDAGKQRDNDWIITFVSDCFVGDALRWHVSLDPNIQDNWKMLQAAIFVQWPREGGMDFTPHTGGFGQQQPKPTFGATGGIFGQPATTTATTSTPAFGGFGAATDTATAGFGSTSNTSGGGPFGRLATSSGAFGSSTPATTAGGPFGNKPPGTATATTFGTTAFSPTTAGTNNGTASPTYQITSEKEGTNPGMTNYEPITCMPAYKNFSFEELRTQDYTTGRKTATSTGFGGTGAFGATAAPTTTAGTFGQPAAPTTTTFGQPAAATTGGFGSTTTATGFFGQPAAQQQQQQQPATGFGGFGQTSTTGGGLFGQNN